MAVIWHVWKYALLFAAIAPLSHCAQWQTVNTVRVTNNDLPYQSWIEEIKTRNRFFSMQGKRESCGSATNTRSRKLFWAMLSCYGKRSEEQNTLLISRMCRPRQQHPCLVSSQRQLTPINKEITAENVCMHRDTSFRSMMVLTQSNHVVT